MPLPIGPSGSVSMSSWGEISSIRLKSVGGPRPSSYAADFLVSFAAAALAAAAFAAAAALALSFLAAARRFSSSSARFASLASRSAALASSLPSSRLAASSSSLFRSRSSFSMFTLYRVDTARNPALYPECSTRNDSYTHSSVELSLPL